ncbi:MAG: alpha/beta fold hydrolase, partial [Oleibacter sp.]|nr:alpha/beta fold hydrolase [Thalassolituus sp.]
PIVLVHGSFCNRGFWISSKGHGFASYLVKQGFDVWMMEHRGHGLSPRNHDFGKNTVERYATADVPAVHEFIMEQTGKSPVWVGHSLGGNMIAAAVAGGTFQVNPSAMVLMGSQTVRRNWYLQIPGVGALVRLYLSTQQDVDGSRLNLGPENEPAGVASEYIRRHSLLGKWRFADSKYLLTPGWSVANVPMLGIAGQSDTLDPPEACAKFYQSYGGPKEIVILSKENGFSKDLGHVGMVIGREAQQEVWPKIADWLKGYAIA